MGIRDKPTAPASPWQNGFAERLIGSIRRECVDHVIVLGEVHLRQILQLYAQDAPVIGQRCTSLSPNSANRKHQITRHPWRTSPPLRPSLSFRYTQAYSLFIREGSPDQSGEILWQISELEQECERRLSEAEKRSN